MAKKVKKTDKTKTEKTANIDKVVFLRERRLTVSVGTAADFGKAKFGLSLSQNLKDNEDSMEICNHMYDELVEKLEEKFNDLCEKIGVDDEDDIKGEVADDDDDDDSDDDDDDDDSDDDDSDDDDDDSDDDDSDDDDDDDDDDDSDDDDDDDDDITEDEILKMKRPGLIKLIEDEELDINAKKIKKIGDLRQAIIDGLFEDDDSDDDDDDGDWEGGDDDDDDDDWGDDD